MKKLFIYISLFIFSHFNNNIVASNIFYLKISPSHSSLQSQRAIKANVFILHIPSATNLQINNHEIESLGQFEVKKLSFITTSVLTHNEDDVKHEEKYMPKQNQKHINISINYYDSQIKQYITQRIRITNTFFGLNLFDNPFTIYGIINDKAGEAKNDKEIFAIESTRFNQNLNIEEQLEDLNITVSKTYQAVAQLANQNDASKHDSAKKID